MATVLFAREPSRRRAGVVEAAPVGEVGAAERTPAATRAARLMKETVIDPFLDFLRRPWWAAILVFVVLYRFPDSFLSVMANVFYKDLGFSNSEIASVSKLFGTGATLAGVFLGGLLVHRLGLLKSLVVCGVVQMLSNLVYITMAQSGRSVPVFAATVAAENVSGGMTGVAFVAYLSSLCSPGFAGSQYALLSSLGLFFRNSISAASGWLVEAIGWSWFFVVSALVAVPGMVLLVFFVLSGRFEEAAPEPAPTAQG
jgi:PAT family beta-lactamase induction signal transducer AmpG